MGFLDKLFKPKYDPNDFYTDRLRAVEKITDEKVLANIAKIDEWDEIRHKAVKKISEESLLADIAKNESDSSDVCKEAIKKISDESLLADVAINNSNYGHNAVEKISDESLLADIAKNSSNYYAYTKAIEKIHDKYL